MSRGIFDFFGFGGNQRRGRGGNRGGRGGRGTGGLRFQDHQLDHYQTVLKAYTGAFAETSQNKVDEGGKILLPASCLERLAAMKIVYPMLFKVTNPQNNRFTHCGVLEFSAREGITIIPFWMQQQLGIKPGQIINLENATMQKGTFCKIRPVSRKFIEDLSNPKVVLERKLRNFTCLSKGDRIMIIHNGTSFQIDIREVRDSNGPCQSISIVDSDVKVEFERPLDMPPDDEVIRRNVPPTTSVGNVGVTGYASGPQPQPPSGLFFGSERKDINEDLSSSSGSDDDEDDEEKKRERKKRNFIPFGGSGHSISGNKKSFSTTQNNNNNNNNSNRRTKKEEEKKQRSNFKPFQGSGFSLTGKSSRYQNMDVSSSSNNNNNNNNEGNIDTKKRKFKPFAGSGYSLK